MKRILPGILIVASAFGQSASSGPQFDAVSIHPSAPDARGGGFNLSPGRLNAKNQSLKDLVQFAFDMKDFQVSGGPGWTDNDRYEVVATFSGKVTNAQRAQMMQAMLVDRFALTVRHESKEVSGYALIVGKGGQKLHAPEPNVHESMMMGRNAEGQRTLTATSADMKGLASILADILGRPVEDKTGMEGLFDFSMAWTPDAMTEGPRAPGVGKLPVAADDQSGPSIFTALQEKLGLKLDTGKVSVDAIVIEHAEKPSGN